MGKKDPGYPLQSQRRDLGFGFGFVVFFFSFHFFVCLLFEQWCGNLDVTGFMLPDGVGSIVIRVSSVSEIGAEKWEGLIQQENVPMYGGDSGEGHVQLHVKRVLWKDTGASNSDRPGSEIWLLSSANFLPLWAFVFILKKRMIFFLLFKFN